MATVLSQELRRAARLCVELWSVLAGLIHHGKKIGQCLLALGGVRRSRSKRFQSTIDGLVDGVPIRRGTRLQARLRLVPRRLKVFDARLCRREVTLVARAFVSTTMALNFERSPSLEGVAASTDVMIAK